MSDWTQQPDGTLLPSQELVDHVRQNPDLFPNAISDFSKITGKSEDEVQAIFDNTGHMFGMGVATDLAQGVLDGAANAAENLVPEKYLGDAGKDIRSYSESLDPKFDTQKGIVEHLTEGVGQYAPAVAAGVAVGIATGGAGWAPFLASAGVSTLVSGSNDNFFKTMNEVAPGITPDILVPQADDSPDVLALKNLAGNVVMDGITLGAFGLVGRALKGLKNAIMPGASKEAVAAGEKAISESAAEIKPEAQAIKPEAQAVTPEMQALTPEGAPVPFQPLDKEGVAALKGAAEEVRGLKQDSLLNSEEAATRSRARYRNEIAAKFDGATPPAPVEDSQLRAKFLDNVAKIADRMETRSEQVSGGIRPSDRMAMGARSFINKVYDALQSGDDDALLKVAQTGVQGKGTVDASYAHAITAAAIHQANHEKGLAFEEMLGLIRDSRKNGVDLSVKEASNATAKNLMSTLLQLRELDWHLGSTSSYIMNYRKALAEGDGDFLRRAEEFAKEQVAPHGISLFDDRLQFMDKMAAQLDNTGINFVKAMEQLDDMFNEFDVARRGTLASLKENSVVRMSPEEKARAAASWVRMVKDVQTTALLSQFGTTGVNLIGEGLNTLLLPAIENGLGSGNLSRMTREYAGYIAGIKRARQIAVDAWQSGTAKIDGHSITEGTLSDYLSYERASFAEAPFRHLMIRMFKLATDASLATTEFWKAVRAQGITYADGLELGIKSGMGRVEAKAFAREYVEKQFSDTGKLVNGNYLQDVRETSWGSPFDTRYMLGKVGMAVDNWRNRNDALGVLGTMAIPFFRTIVNIGSNATQMIVPPGLPSALKFMANQEKFKFLQSMPKVFKVLDDFTGANGEAAMNRALGRQRLGMGLTAAAYALTEMSDSFDISGSSGIRKWDAKKRAFEEYPPNSMIIGDHAVDLSRLLPYSAPLMLVGVLRDMKKEAMLQIKGGNYVADGGAAQDLADYAPALFVTMMTLFQDSSATQGVFGLFDAMNRLADTGNTDALQKYMETYAQQFTPGLVKMAAKNINDTQYEGYDFFSRFAAAAGFEVGSPKLDFVGDPITYEFGRGIDPLNTKKLETSDPLHKEFVKLNQSEGLALVPPKPDKVFDKNFWEKMGVDTGGFLDSGNEPSLVDLRTVDGKNGWDAYRELLYKGRASQDTQVTVSNDGVPIGAAVIREGQTFKEAAASIITSQSYHNLTSDARKQVWQNVFGFYKEHAKAQLQDRLVIHPQVFDNSRYGSPIAQPSALGDVLKASVGMAAKTQQTKGSPLDAAFSIK